MKSGEAEAKHDGAPNAPSSPQAARDAIDEPDENDIDLGLRSPPAAERVLRPHGSAAAPLLHPTSVAVVRECVQLAP